MSDPKDITIGIDLGGTKILGAAVDQQGRILQKMVRPAPHDNEEELIRELAEMICILAQRSREKGLAPQAAGIGAPGFVDPQRRVLISSANLNVKHVSLGETLESRTGLRVALTNDIKAAALGEQRFGAGRGKRCYAYLNVGTGIAVGLVFDGKIFNGAHFRSGEIGHTVIEPDGTRCACGKRGCLEALASGPAILREARLSAATNPESALARLCAGNPADLTANMLDEALRGGDPAAVAVVDKAADYLGRAAAWLVNVLGLDYIALGGGVMRMQDLILGPVRAAMERYVIDEYHGEVRLEPSILGQDAGVLGAAVLAAGPEAQFSEHEQIVDVHPLEDGEAT